jgi:hypothetical protein
LQHQGLSCFLASVSNASNSVAYIIRKK